MRHMAGVSLVISMALGGLPVMAVGPTANNSTNSVAVLSARYGVNLPYTDPNSGTMAFTLISAPTLGFLTYYGTGGYTNLPPGVPVSANYWYYTTTSTVTGTDSFAWQVSDGTSTSAVATVTMILTTNTPITATATTNSVTVGTVRYGIYLSNTDPDWYQPKTAQLVVPPTRGTLEYNTGSSYVTIASNDWTQFQTGSSPYWYYTPSGMSPGTDSFQWRISDGLSTSIVVTMGMTINGNTAPVANNQTLTVVAGSTRTYIGPNYTDPDYYQTKTFQLVTAPTRGLLEYYSGAPYSPIPTNTPITSSSWYYTPSGQTAGTDTFTWWVTDGYATSAVATATITITANSPPVLTHPAIAITCLKNTTNDLTAFLAYTHKDVGQTMVFTLTAAPTNGTLVSSGITLHSGDTAYVNGWSYIPFLNFTGSDAFAWTASDGVLTTDPGNVSITVVAPAAANTPPVFKAGVKLMDGAKTLALGTQVVNGKYDWAGGGNAQTTRNNAMVVAAPELVDWNNDGLMDLLVGQADGRIALFINHGTKGHPVFNGFTYITLSNGKAIQSYLGGCICDGGGPECPAPRVVDWDNDGRKDLLLGEWCGNGVGLFVYFNQGTDESPVFYEKMGCQLYSNTPFPTAMPCITDWNGDGVTDLISGDNAVWGSGHSYSAPTGVINVFLGKDNDHGPAAVYSANCNNYELFNWDEYTPSDSFLSTSPSLTTTNACPVGSRKSVVAADLTGSGKKDLVTGMQDGTVYYSPNVGTKNFPVYTNYFRLQAGGSNIIVGTASKLGQDPGYGTQGNMLNQLCLPSVNEARIAIADLDGDGLPDLVVGDVSGNVTFFQQYNPNPVAIDQNVIVMPNASKAITLTARVDSGHAVTYSVTTNPAHGYLSGSSSNIVYTPNQDYLGSDLFTFKASDGTNSSRTATVSLTMKSHPPAAQWLAPTTLSSAAIVNMNTPAVLTLTATDAGDEPLTYNIVTGPAHGTCSISSNLVTYTPTPGYAGLDSFTYQANDGYLASAPATVSLDVCVMAVNFQPKATPVPAGFRIDSGSNFDAGRGYGWNINLASQTAARNRDPNPVLDTLVWSSNATWTCNLSNGNYLVSYACGDAISSYGVYGPHQVVVQGVPVTTNITTGADTFAVTGNVPVTVTNGQLTVAIGDGVHNTGLNYLLVRTAYHAAGGAAFVTEDDTTQGSWKGVYGADGCKIITGLLGPRGADFQVDYVANYDPWFELVETPAYVAMSGPPDGGWGSAQWKAWAFPTNDIRALDYPTLDDGSRIAACWNASVGNSFVADLNFTDSQTHRVAVYCMAWGNSTWAQTLTVLDNDDGTVLDTRSLANFGSGKWLVWDLKGHVKIRVTCTAGSAAVSGFFFGTYAPPSIVEQPLDDAAQTGQNATFSLSASGIPLFYQWQRSNDGGVTWSNLSGATANTYTFATTLGDNMARFRCVVSNSYGTVTSDATRLTVSDALPPAPVITSPLVVSAVYNQSFSYTITTRNTATYFDAFLPPQVFNIDTSLGLITSSSPAYWVGANTSWTTGPGTLYIPIFAGNAGGEDARTLIVVVNPTNAPVVTGTLAVTGMVGVPLSYTITGINGPTSYTASGLPAGLTLNTVSGVISGTPTLAAAGLTSVMVGAKNANGTGLAQLSVNILNAPSVAAYSPRNPWAMMAGTTNQFSVTIAHPDGDTLNYVWKRDGAATGTNLSSCSYISGTNAGLYALAVVAADTTWGSSVTQTWAITVQTSNRLPVAQNQSVYLPMNATWPVTLTGTDADGNYLTYSVVTGPTNGTLSGTAPALTYTPTPGYEGPDQFTFEANDGFANGNIATVSITVLETPVLSFALVNTAPQEMLPVSISATVTTTSALQSISLTNYWHDWPNGAWSAIPMTSNQFGVFTGVTPIPGRPAGSVVEYYVGATYGWPTWTLFTNSVTNAYTVQTATRMSGLSVTGAVTANLLLGGNARWQRAVAVNDLVDAPIWFAGVSNGFTTLWGDLNPVSYDLPECGVAEAVTAAPITLYGENTGFLAFTFNESNLVYSVVGCDYVNFDSWPNAPYGNYTNNGWVVSGGQITNDAAHVLPAVGSGAFVVLNGSPNPGSNSCLRSPYRTNGIGQISFWARNWETTGTPAGQLLVQVAPSDTSTTWITVATLTNIVSPNYVWSNIPWNDSTNHCARILNNPAGTGARVCLDEVVVADLGANVLGTNLTTSPPAPTVLDPVNVSVSVTRNLGAVVTGMVCWYGTNGVYQSIPMTTLDGVRYVTSSPILDFRTGTVQYAVQCSFAGYASEITSPTFFPPGGTNQPQSYTVGGPTTGYYTQGFETNDYWVGLPWTSNSNNITNATSGWVVNDAKIWGQKKNSGSYAAFLPKADGSNAWVRTPLLSNGVSTISLYAQNYFNSGIQTNRLNVESSYDGVTWFTNAVLTNTLSTGFTQLTCLVASSSNQYVRFRKVTSNSYDLALDDIMVSPYYDSYPSGVIVTNIGLNPAAPTIADTVSVSCDVLQANPLFAAYRIAPTLFYRAAGGGTYMTVPMAQCVGTSNTFAAAIPPFNPIPGARVEYCIRCDYSGYHALPPVFYPAGGTNSPTNYVTQAYVPPPFPGNTPILSMRLDSNVWIECVNTSQLPLTLWYSTNLLDPNGWMGVTSFCVGALSASNTYAINFWGPTNCPACFFILGTTNAP